jgi:hypothetical protein
MASYSFVNAYAVNTATSPAAKEQNSIDIDITAPLGGVTVNDDTPNYNFNGNDVVAISITIGGQSYYGWISRPIKVGGQVKGFYFWYDQDWTGVNGLSLATADGNSDGDDNIADNKAFVLVVDQSYFNTLAPYSGNLVNVGSSSDRVDSALNSLLVNHAPVAGVDTGTAVEPAVPGTPPPARTPWRTCSRTTPIRTRATRRRSRRSARPRRPMQ